MQKAYILLLFVLFAGSPTVFSAAICGNDATQSGSEMTLLPRCVDGRMKALLRKISQAYLFDFEDEAEGHSVPKHQHTYMYEFDRINENLEKMYPFETYPTLKSP